MDRSPALSLALPRPGRALWAVLGTVAVLGILSAILANWVPGVGEALFGSLVFVVGRGFREPWRLFSSGLLTSPAERTHLLFSLLGLYFLGAPLERRWGGLRFVGFLCLGVVFGNLIALAVSGLAPGNSVGPFHPVFVFGPGAAIAAIAVAWSREYPDATVNLFFFLPVRAKNFLWLTIGFCVLDLVYPAGIPEGVVAPFGGVLAGLAFGGNPSPARATWLRVRLFFLRRGAGNLRSQDILAPRPTRRARPGAPPLRVVPGGLEEVLKKRTPPKDKRYLN